MVNKQSKKCKLSSAFFSASFEIQDVRDMKVSGIFFVVYDDKLNHEYHDSEFDNVKFNPRQIALWAWKNAWTWTWLR